MIDIYYQDIDVSENESEDELIPSSILILLIVLSIIFIILIMYAQGIA